MRRLMMGILAGLVAAAASGATAQSPELRAKHARVMQLYATGHFADAVTAAAQALDLGKQEFGVVHPSTAALMVNLAKLHGELDQWPQAEDLYREAAEIRSATLGMSDPDTGEAYAGLGNALQQQARFGEAEESYWRALDTLGVELARNPHVMDTVSLRAGLYRAWAVYNRAHQLVEQARLDEAELMYQSAIATFQANSTIDRAIIVQALGKRAFVLKALGRDEEAAALDAHAVAVSKGRASCPAGLFTTC